MDLEMNNLSYRKAVLIALVIYHLTTFVAPTTSNGNSILVSTSSEGQPIQTYFNDESEGLDSLKGQDHIAGNHHLKMKQREESDEAHINNNEHEKDPHNFISSNNIEWKLRSDMEQGAATQLGIRTPREKRDAQGLDKRLSYDRMGKRGLGDKRFTDAMRLGKRESPGGTSSFVDAMRLGKRYTDAMRLGKRAALRFGKRAAMDTMRLGKRMDAMRLGKRAAMDTMRLGKRIDAMRLGKRVPMSWDMRQKNMRLGKRMYDMKFGKRMDQMRLGKRDYNIDGAAFHSLANSKRMGDVMRLGKRNDNMDGVEKPVEEKRMSDLMRLGKRGQSNAFGNNLDEESLDIGKRMSDLMRLGKRMDIMPLEPEKRMSDLMRLGKRFGYDNRYGKRAFMDDMRMGKRAFMDDMRMGKRMGDVMRLGKRMPDAMRLGKRGIDYPVDYDHPTLANELIYVNADDYEDSY